MSAAHLATHPSGKSDLIVTMEPLLIQMYAGPGARIANLESVTPDELKLLLPTSDNTRDTNQWLLDERIGLMAPIENR